MSLSGTSTSASIRLSSLIVIFGTAPSSPWPLPYWLHAREADHGRPSKLRTVPWPRSPAPVRFVHLNSTLGLREWL